MKTYDLQPYAFILPLTLQFAAFTTNHILGLGGCSNTHLPVLPLLVAMASKG